MEESQTQVKDGLVRRMAGRTGENERGCDQGPRLLPRKVSISLCSVGIQETFWKVTY